MKQRDQLAQFASAWVADGRQILAYLWEEDDKYYVMHHTMDPTLRLSFGLDFKTEGDAWAYFHALRTSSKGAREKVENIFEGLFEECGKEYEQKEERNEDEDDQEGPPFEN